ncbi:MAG TPA: toll/interleukin-1 receptor domain-containing protein [Anaerolineales bacterium]|nr:toll/interleukin-1 receptor domain-containing protein [Anaerolineales bacterium]
MTKNIFMSYSRREVGFIDDLVRNLEQTGYDVWLDYCSLVPGRPWQDQIYQGIQNADVILLVVSKASLSSQNVEVEWRHVIEQNKRVILLVFEAVDLPTELEKYEWVDFRGSYKAGLKELLSQLEQPVVEEHPVPETGFKVPMIVWAAAILSAIVAIYSLSAFWTLFIPWLLFLLPYRIFKRNFNFTQVQAALLILPVALFMTGMTITDEVKLNSVTSAFCVSLPLIGILVFILRSPAMQRWGKEQATMPRFANPYVPNNPNPQPVSFFVDYAPEDRKVADEMIDVLKKYGHVQAAQLPEAQSVLVLLSRYKGNSSADPEKQVVFPIILQTNRDISKDLSKVQWVDLRPGVRKLDAIAQLLPEPAKLLKALGNRPRGNQLVLPAPIMAMMYFLVVLGIFALGSFFQFFFGLAASDISSDTFGNAFGPALFPFLFILLFIGILLFSMARSLVQRRGRLASFRNFTIALAVLGFLLLGEVILGANVFDTLAAHEPNINEFASNVTLFPFLIYVIGGLIMAVFLFTRRKDILLWFPAKRPGK